MISITLPVVSDACLPLVKPVWSGLIKVDKIERSLWARILAYNFTSLFSKEIGLKLASVLGSLPGFGIVTTYALSISAGNEVEDIASE